MMVNEQPNTPSAEVVQTPDAAPSESSSDRPEEKASESPAWWQRMFHRRGQEPEPEDADTAPKDDATSKPLQLTQEELDRRVQAETDRREAKRAQEAKAHQRKQLRDTDPWAYAEEERKAEQTAATGDQWTQFFTSVGTEHDRAAIDPVVELLPAQERERIFKLDGAGTGLAGRKLVVQESLKALEKHWKSEGEKQAERKLRSNAAFRKQVLAESRGQTVEPELLPAMSASEADQTVSGLLRGHYGLRTHNEAS